MAAPCDRTAVVLLPAQVWLSPQKGQQKGTLCPVRSGAAWPKGHAQAWAAADNLSGPLHLAPTQCCWCK